MALHTINFNSFVGFGGSDLGHRGARDISKHHDDVTDWNDVGIYDQLGGKGWNDVGICGKLGGEGSGGTALDGQVVSGVCGSALVMGLVEGKSNAHNTTEIATTNDIDNDNDDDNDKARRATSPMHGEDLCLPPGGSAIQEASGVRNR